MKCLLLSAGFGTRLKKLNINTPKGLLQYRGLPLVTHIVNKIPADIEIYLHTNLLYEDEYRNWGKLINRDVKISVEPVSDISGALGAIGSINYFIQNNSVYDDLLVLATDNYFDFNLAEFINRFDGQHPLIAVYDIKDSAKAKNFGVVTLKDGRIASFVEKPPDPETSLVSIACYIFPRGVLAELKKFNLRGTKDNLGDLIRYLVELLPVHAFVFEGDWFDIGNETDYKEIISGNAE